MTLWPASKVRSTFIDFFRARDHEFVSSSPVLPHEDPTLTFVNSGMCQFKPIFLGTVDPSTSMAKLQRAANSQKCIRAGGKHNDLDDVGKDTYHHTFFEMLGNWSFGDYFKKEAVSWAFELLVDVYGLKVEQMYATYFGGNESLNIPPDYEARQLWESLLPEGHVIPGNMKDNFWEMGPVGPCGPCSEVHYDRIGSRNAASLVNKDDPDVIEIWNLVFMQFSREADGSIHSLPAKHIDTGMGFERLVSILQDKRSNYDTDVFLPIFQDIKRLSKVSREYEGRVGADDHDGIDMAYRVVADHIRNVCIAIADGIIPGNTDRNYVLRRILRRGIRYSHQFLKAEVGFLSKLVDTVVSQMGDVFPELVANKDRIKDVIYEEEVSFARTLDRGIEVFNKLADEIQNAGNSVVSGNDVFILYDTFGFPVDLTEILAGERGMTIDKDGYSVEMEVAKERSRNRGQHFASDITFEAEQTSFLRNSGVSPTIDIAKYSWGKEIDATIKAIYSAKQFLECTDDSEEAVALILDESNFYAESGGQIFDTGRIFSMNSFFEVFDCQVYGGYILHFGTVSKGKFNVGDSVRLSVDYDRRRLIAPNHTMTHVLNFALERTLGKGIDQMGSLVDQDKLRFDFSYNKPIKRAQLERIESIVNDQIQKKLSVYTMVAPLESAKKIISLRAVFGEVYPDPVRVVSVGTPIEPMLKDPLNPVWNDYSVEFCGGTHLGNTKDAVVFSIISEEGVSKGVRRIVAYTGKAAQTSAMTGTEYLAKLKSIEDASNENSLENVSNLRSELSSGKVKLPSIVRLELEERIEKLVKQLHKNKNAKAKENTENAVNDVVRLVGAEVDAGRKVMVLPLDVGLDTKALKEATSKALESYEGVAVMLVGWDISKGRVLVYAGMSSSLISDVVDASKWCNGTLEAFSGKGGGKPVLAQGQGKISSASQIDELCSAAKTWMQGKI